MTINILKHNNQPAFAIVPYNEYKAMLEAYEGFQDLKRVSKFKKEKHSFFPEEIPSRIIKGENPIKVYREYRNITQESLAKTLSVSKQYISQIENNKTKPSLKILKGLAQILNVTVDDLLE